LLESVNVCARACVRVRVLGCTGQALWHTELPWIQRHCWWLSATCLQHMQHKSCKRRSLGCPIGCACRLQLAVPTAHNKLRMLLARSCACRSLKAMHAPVQSRVHVVRLSLHMLGCHHQNACLPSTWCASHTATPTANV